MIALASIPNSMHHLTQSFHTDERGPEDHALLFRGRRNQVVNYSIQYRQIEILYNTELVAVKINICPYLLQYRQTDILHILKNFFLFNGRKFTS